MHGSWLNPTRRRIPPRPASHSSRPARTFPQRRLAVWPAMRLGSSCTTIPTVASPRSAPEPGPFRRRCGGRSSIETAAVASRAADCRSARAITSATGPMAAPRRCRTWLCSVGATTARSTKTATRSNGSRMERSASGGRTGSYCRTFPLPLQCQRTRWTRCERRTTHEAFRSAPARRCPAGWASVSTSATRSTSCIRWPRPRDRHSGTGTIAASDSHLAIAGGRSVNPLRPRGVLRLAPRAGRMRGCGYVPASRVPPREPSARRYVVRGLARALRYGRAERGRRVGGLAGAGTETEPGRRP